MQESSESINQQQLFLWAALQSGRYPQLALMFHIPNEGKRSKYTGGRMRAEGMKAGVPDIFLPVPSGQYHGLFIEMKSEGGRPSREQTMWLNSLERQGYRVGVCKGFEQAAALIMDYLKIKGGIYHVQ